MNHFCVENQGSHTYLVYAVDSGEEIDNITLNVLTNPRNEIHGLAKITFSQMNATKYFKYDVTAKKQMGRFFEDGPVTKKRLIGVFKGIAEALLSAETYFLDVNSFLLDEEYIYVDAATSEPVLICLPLSLQKPDSNDLGDFFRRVFFSLSFDKNENCNHVAEILNFLNRSQVFSLYEFKNLLESIENSPVSVQPQHDQSPKKKQSAVPEKKQQPVVSEKPRPDVPERAKEHAVSDKPEPAVKTTQSEQSVASEEMSLLYLLTHYSKENAEKYRKQKVERARSHNSDRGMMIPGQVEEIKHESAASSADWKMDQRYSQGTDPHSEAMNYGETIYPEYLRTGGETVFGETVKASNRRAYLVYLKNDELIPVDFDINRKTFRIGRLVSEVDYLISDNPTIGRTHADISFENGEYFVIDNNSKNHTYVNGKEIQGGVRVKIEDGTKLRFSNEEFEFRLR